MMFIGGTPPAAVNDDLTFELKGNPGNMRVALFGPTPGWTIRTVRYRGSDVTDSGVEIRPNENLTDVEVELTNRPTEVSGLVTNAKGEALKDYSVIVFPQDREKWTANSRYVKSSRPDQDGRFKVAIGERQIDFRVSIMPSIFGEDAVLRVLDKQDLMVSFGPSSAAR